MLPHKRNVTVNNTMFPHCSIHKCTWTCPDGKTCYHIDHGFVGKRHSSVIDILIF